MSEVDRRVEALARVADGFHKIEELTRVIEAQGVTNKEHVLHQTLTDLLKKVADAAADLAQIKDMIAEATRKSDRAQIIEDNLAKATANTTADLAMTTEVLEIVKGMQNEAEAQKSQASGLRAAQEESKMSLDQLLRNAETWKGQADEWKVSLKRLKKAKKRARKRKAQADEWKSIVRKTKASLEQAEKDAMIWKAETDTWRTKHDEIEDSLEKLQEEATARKAQVDDWQAGNEKIRASQKRLEQQAKTWKGEVGEWKSKHAEIEASLKEVQKEADSRKDEADARCYTLSKDLETAQQRTESLERKLERVTADHKASDEKLRREMQKLQQQPAAVQRLSLPSARDEFASSRVTETPNTTILSSDDEQVSMGPAKRKRTTGIDISDTSLIVHGGKRKRTGATAAADASLKAQSPRPAESEVPQLDARSKANEIRALMEPQWSITDEEEKILMNHMTSWFSKKASLTDKLKTLEHCVVGNLSAEPPNPRPCLLALMVRRNGGAGGPQMKSTDCPYCNEKPDERLCCYATYAQGVSSGYGPRVGGKVQNTRWIERPEPYTNAQQVRYLLFKRPGGDAQTSS